MPVMSHAESVSKWFEDPEIREAKARELASSGDYAQIIGSLNEIGLLEEQTERVYTKFRDNLEHSSFIGENELEMLAVVDLYSEVLSEHSVSTYEIAKNKVNRLKLGDNTLIEIIQSEDVDLDEFYRACLFHDIGKITLTHAVHDNKIDRSSWLTLARDHGFGDKLEQGHTPDAVIPIHLILEEEELVELEERGISRDATFREIIQTHESASRNILHSLGFVKEAIIAGQHHNYNNEELVYPISSQSIGVSAHMSDLIHLADVESALGSNRAYLREWSHLSILKQLIDHAEKGMVSSKILTALWVEDEIASVEDAGDGNNDSDLLQDINEFIKSYLYNV